MLKFWVFFWVRHQWKAITIEMAVSFSCETAGEVFFKAYFMTDSIFIPLYRESKFFHLIVQLFEKDEHRKNSIGIETWRIHPHASKGTRNNDATLNQAQIVSYMGHTSKWLERQYDLYFTHTHIVAPNIRYSPRFFLSIFLIIPFNLRCGCSDEFIRLWINCKSFTFFRIQNKKFARSLTKWTKKKLHVTHWVAVIWIVHTRVLVCMWENKHV